MKVIVPLAGPDFERTDGGVKATIEIDGTPLLRRALDARAWWIRGQIAPADLIFVLRDTPMSQAFANDVLKHWYPGAALLSLSRYTRGAALSALAGVAMMADPDEILCVDLADIEYRTTLDPVDRFARATRADGIALTFSSDDPAYSYLRTDASQRVVEAAEKRVISSNASAGTYFFRNTATYLRALAHSLDHASDVMHRDLFFVCPLFNGIVARKRDVVLEEVVDVLDIKTAR